MNSSENRRIWKYYWDRDDLVLSTVDRLAETEINERKLSDYIGDERISNHIFIGQNEVKLRPRNMFGEIIVKTGDEERFCRVVPKKLFHASTVSPEEAYTRVRECIIKNLEEFTSMIVKEIRDIQAVESLRLLVSDLAYTYDFLVILLEKYEKTLKYATRQLFATGPIHREQVTTSGAFGNSLSVRSLQHVDPYLQFSKKTFTYNTELNRMVFQSLYYLAIEAAFVKAVARAIDGEGQKSAERRMGKIIRSCISTIEQYHLWPFFQTEPLNVGMLSMAVRRQQNVYYREIFEIYRSLLEILYAKNIRVSEKVSFPIISFEHIYEIWAISRILSALLGNKTEPKIVPASRKGEAKAIFKADKVTLIWELRKPISESLYLGSLIRSDAIPKNALLNSADSNIKPDIVILKRKGNGKIEKAILGDVKFKVDENGYLPKIDDVYKVLGYVLDLGRTDMFESAPVEGMLIYPGTLEEPVKLPLSVPSENSTNIVYIHLIPLRIDSRSITEYVRRIVES